MHRILVSERDLVLTRSLRAAADHAAAQGSTPGLGLCAPCVVGVVGHSHLPGIARLWPQADAPHGDSSGPAPRGGAAGNGARLGRAGVRAEHSAADGASGRVPGSSQPSAGQAHDRMAGSEASASSHSSRGRRGEAGAAAGPGGTAAPEAEGSAIECMVAGHSMAAPEAQNPAARRDEYRDEALGVRRALLERLIDLMALPEVVEDLRAMLPGLAPGAASAAHADALELYGAPRMLLACLTREQLALVRAGAAVELGEEATQCV